jgi:hypothetical protein
VAAALTLRAAGEEALASPMPLPVPAPGF